MNVQTFPKKEAGSEPEAWAAPSEHEFILSFWKENHDSNGLIPKTKINPFDLKPVLPCMLLMELDEEDQWRFSLVGTGIVNEYGADFTGTKLADFDFPSCRNVYQSLVEACEKESGPYTCIGTLRYPDRDFLDSTKTVVPVTKKEGRLTHCVIVLTIDDRSMGIEHPYRPYYPLGAHDALLKVSEESSGEKSKWSVTYVRDIDYTY